MKRYTLIESDVALAKDANLVPISNADKVVIANTSSVEIENIKKQLQKPVFISWWWINKILGRKLSMSEKQYYMRHYQKKLSALMFYDLWVKICGFASITLPTLGLIFNNLGLMTAGIISAVCYVVFKCILMFEKLYFSNFYWRFYKEGAIKVSESDVLESLKDLTTEKLKSLANSTIVAIRKLYNSLFSNGSLLDEMGEQKILLFAGLISAAAIIAYYFY